MLVTFHNIMSLIHVINEMYPIVLNVVTVINHHSIITITFYF